MTSNGKISDFHGFIPYIHRYRYTWCRNTDWKVAAMSKFAFGLLTAFIGFIIGVLAFGILIGGF